MKLGLFVITHKKLSYKLQNDRKFLLVGSFDKEENYGYIRDDIGKNISNRNSNYCELTGLYWMIKNTNYDILGLEHYRRFFISRQLYLFKFPILREKKIKKILSKYDIILPNKFYLKESVISKYSKGHIIDDLIEVGKVIKEKYSEYYDSYVYIMNGNYFYPCNMFIGKREVVEEYANWLFDILFEVEKRINLTGRDAYQSRVFGFLSERMMAIYMHHNSNIKICEKRIEMVEDKPFITQWKRFKRKILRIKEKK